LIRLPADRLPTDELARRQRQARASWPGGTKGPCLEIHGLKTCVVNGLPATDILFAWVRVPDRPSPLLLESGLAGNGMTARTILYSLHPDAAQMRAVAAAAAAAAAARAALKAAAKRS